MFKNRFKNIALIFATCLASQQVYSTEIKTSEKKVYLPSQIWNVPANNNFKNDTSEFSFSRMKESKNIAIFWSKKFGSNPLNNTDSTLRFNTTEILKEGERIYNHYVNNLKFIEKGKSLTDKYKCLIFIINTNEGTAFGGGAENKIGIFWAPPARMSKGPFGALAHELGHSFQYLTMADRAKGDTTELQGGGSYSFVEMTSQYMLWQVYPEWLSFENYHLNDFMKQTHLAFLHESNMYHSPFVLEYWSEKHGVDFIGKIWREGTTNEDPVMTYKRLTSINQDKFNDEMFDAARRFVTWDMKRIEKVSRKYANQHFTKLDSIANGWYKISETKCPQNYGYNAIKLITPKAGTALTLNFKGIAGAEGYRAIKTDKAGWRYGFVAVKENGGRVYGKMYSNPNGEVQFKVPNDTQYLWLVVSGAPTEHWKHDVDGDDKNDEQWPYKIKLTGTTLDKSAIK